MQINPSSIVVMALALRGCGGGLRAVSGIGARCPGGVVNGFSLAWGWLFLGVGWVVGGILVLGFYCLGVVRVVGWGRWWVCSEK